MGGASMAASMVRSYGLFSSLRQFLRDISKQESNINKGLFRFYLDYTQLRCYRTTSICLKSRLHRDKKKERLQILENKDLNSYIAEDTGKKELPFIVVWKNMTPNELAHSAQRNINDVYEVLKGYDDNPHYIITNMNKIIQAVKLLGGRAKIVVNPTEKMKEKAKHQDITRQPPPDESVLVRRHPVVTIMGHVDHGKTTLLDALRDTAVAQSEFGGITQHIGAFNVTLKSGERVTFLDTPGHAAFASMRSRGAHVTDIVVLVVAADDGVQDQTLQSIEMAKKANVPIIVAINKIDKPDADIKRTESMLVTHGIVTEASGGDIQSVNISALKKTNLETLTEAIVLQAEIMGLKADPVGLVEAVVIECSNHAGRGKLVTALIKRGTLKKGCLLVSGLASAKVRAMFNDTGCPISEAKPAEAVQIIGWKGLPIVGDEILQVKNDKMLDSILKYRTTKQGENLAQQHKEAADAKYEEYKKKYKKMLGLKREFGRHNPLVKELVKQEAKQILNLDTKKNLVPTVNVIIKGDVAGSVEAILDIFDSYDGDNLCNLNVVHYGVGSVTESDLQLAETFNAIIYHFNVIAPKKVTDEAAKTGIRIKSCNVIYKLIDDIKEEINSKLPDRETEEILGEANVLQQFQITEGKKKVNVAGCRCTKGVLLKSETYRVVRGDEVIYTGKLLSMKHLKDEVSSIKTDVECGLKLDDPTVLFESGDRIICFKTYTVPQNIDWNPGF